MAVKVSSLGKNSRWYAGTGIYRHVWMVTTDRGKALAIVRPIGPSGIIVLKAAAEGLPEASVEIKVKRDRFSQ